MQQPCHPRRAGQGRGALIQWQTPVIGRWGPWTVERSLLMPALSGEGLGLVAVGRPRRLDHISRMPCCLGAGMRVLVLLAKAENSSLFVGQNGIVGNNGFSWNLAMRNGSVVGVGSGTEVLEAAPASKTQHPPASLK